MISNVISKNTRPNVHRSSDLRMLHPVRILGGPITQVDVAIIVENTFVQERNVFEKMIIFLTYIKEPLVISQSASFIINMQLLGPSYFVGTEVSRFQSSADWYLANFFISRLMCWLLDCMLSFLLFARYLCVVVVLYKV